MTKIKYSAAVVILGLSIGSPTFAATPMSDAECTTLMTSMDKNGDGNIGKDEAKPLFDKMADLKKTTKTPDIMTKDEFTTECKAGDFDGVKAQ